MEPSPINALAAILSRHRRLTLVGLVLALIAATGLTLDRLFPPNLTRLATSGSEILDREGRTVALFPAPGGVWRFRATADDVAPVLLDTLIRTEDRHFWYHPGVNPLSLLRATIQAVRTGRVVSGGSTLTMQAARLLEPRPRTVRSKLIEIARALQLEWRYSKRDILGIWLTLAPYGGNLEGVRAGSMAWFGAQPRTLDPAQAALLVAIPRRPEALRPDRHPDAARALRDRVLHADGGEVPHVRQPAPHHARQAVWSLRGPAVVRTTLDAPLQMALERLATERLHRMPDRASMAILVLDARTRAIIAAVSGTETPDEARSWALDLTRAVRSPGSAMKPFIYAMGFEDGIAGPDTPVEDLPRHFGTYAPEDFDRGFAGNVTAAEALRRSLNLPAVALLDQIGPARFQARLRLAGVTLRLPANAAPSLPLALGGAGITLRDLTGLYASLATDGAAMTPRLTPAPPGPAVPFLQPRAAEAIAGVLTQPLPDSGVPGVAWKTGTSWGGRDAWSVGFDRAHVVGVWVGRPDGTPLPGATGRGLALPLLARVFENLPAAPRDLTPVSRGPVAKPRVAASNGLRLLFPPPDAVLSADGPITLRAMGGQRPLTFLVDGAPLATDPARRDVSWLPPAPGFYRLTVLDADGAAARVAVRVKQ
jgi:penicillin-binding protein 1C